MNSTGTRKKNPQFSMFNVADVIKQQLRNPKYLNSLRQGITSRANTVSENCNKKSEEKVYKDYWDGDVVQRMYRETELKWNHILSFTMFIDGMQLFRMSKKGITGVYLVNNLLLKEDRMKPENVIVLCLISSAIDIDYKQFLERVVANFRSAFEINGVTLQVGPKQSIKIGGIITTLVTDIKERDTILLMNAGYYRCNQCYQTGIHENGSVNFPFSEKRELRSRVSFHMDARLSQDGTGNPFRGVKDFSPLLLLEYFDPTVMVPMEVMHTFDLGIVLYLLTIWTGDSKVSVMEKTFGIKPIYVWSSDDKQRLIDRVAKVRLPHGYTRKLDFKDYKSWKADDLRVFCLNLSEEFLEDLLDEPRYAHWKCFVKAYRILMKSTLTGREISYAELMLESFYSGVERLYEKGFCPVKVHQALHAASVVRNFGPLNNVSAYLFEDLNGQIVKRNHAKKLPTENLHNVVEEHFYLSTVLTSLVDADGTLITIDHPYVTYLRKQLGWLILTGTHLSKYWSYMTGLSNKYSYRKSKLQLRDLEDSVLRFVLKHCDPKSTKVIETFAIGRQKFQVRNSAKYSTDSSWIQYTLNNKAYCGQLELALEHNGNYYVVVSTNNTQFKYHTHRGKLKEDRVLKLVPISNICDICVYSESINTYTLSPLHSFHYDVPTTNRRAKNIEYAKMPTNVQEFQDMQKNMDYRVIHKKKN